MADRYLEDWVTDQLYALAGKPLSFLMHRRMLWHFLRSCGYDTKIHRVTKCMGHAGYAESAVVSYIIARARAVPNPSALARQLEDQVSQCKMYCCASRSFILNRQQASDTHDIRMPHWQVLVLYRLLFFLAAHPLSCIVLLSMQLVSVCWPTEGSVLLCSMLNWMQFCKDENHALLQGLPRGRETERFAQDLIDRLPSTNGSARLSQNQQRERQVAAPMLSSPCGVST